MNHKQLIHQWITQFNPLDTVIDMTAGNGHDTYFLSHHATHVIAIDIQEEAIKATQERCKEQHNISYHVQSNAKYQHRRKVDGIMYNLGYLPGSDKSIITTATSTLQSLQHALPYVTKFITISCYRKHDGGDYEYQKVKRFVETNFTKIEVLEYQTELSPVTFLITI